MIISATVCYLLAIQWGGGSKAWSDGNVIATLVMFGVLIIAFAIVEKFEGEYAAIPYHLLKRSIVSNSLYSFFLAGCFFGLLYILPIYFQSVKGVSASNSGVRNLPFVIGASLFTVFSGFFLTMTGLVMPAKVAAGAVTIIGSGLLYLLDVDSSSGAWIGYQALTGIGAGFGFQIPIIANQALVDMADLSTITAVTLFFQTMGGALFVSTGQSVFRNRLAAAITSTAPNVTNEQILNTGATQLTQVFTTQELPGVLAAYIDGIHATFILCIALAGMAFLVAFLPKWDNIKTIQQQKTSEA